MPYCLASCARPLFVVRPLDGAFMELCIDCLKTWYPGCQQSIAVDDPTSFEKIADHTQNNMNIEWPKLDFVPAMQRRRLSPFAKMALLVADGTMQSYDSNMPIIFSSRHGDIHKTSDLLHCIAQDEELSPTAFGLSVHNAVPSLFSILTKNKKIKFNVLTNFFYTWIF